MPKKRKNLEKMIFDNLVILFEVVPEDIQRRVDLELDFIITHDYIDEFLNMVKVSEILKTMFNYTDRVYTITGSINDYYIAYILGITSINPLEYSIDIPKSFRVGINLPIGMKDIVVKELKKHFTNIVKVNSLSKYSYIVVSDNKVYTKEKINLSRPNMYKVKGLIYIDEKYVLTILDRLYSLHDIDIKYDINSIKQFLNSRCHKTTFEELYSIGRVYNFYFHFQSQVEKEYDLTYFKYYYSKDYYFVIINYLLDKIDKQYLKTYLNNYSDAIKYLVSKESLSLKEEYTLEFYKLCFDAVNYSDLDLELNVNDNPINRNLTLIQSHAGEKMPYIFAKEILERIDQKLNVFCLTNDTNFYLSYIFGADMGINASDLKSFINPLNSSKFYINVDVDTNMYIKTIKKLRDSKVCMYDLKLSNMDLVDNIKNISSIDNDVIIIDSLTELVRNSKYTLNQTLELLNNLNKEIIIFDNIYLKNDVNKISFKNIKSKYIKDFYKIENSKKFIINRSE